jgi:hypothetical protein
MSRTDANFPAETATRRPMALGLFGPSPIMEGEDIGLYDELLTRISTAIKPNDILEDIWVREDVDLVWEIFRLRSIKLDDIERIDRMIAIAEARRNAILREINRHREVLSQNLRRAIQDVEDGPLRVIENASVKGGNAQ